MKNLKLLSGVASWAILIYFNIKSDGCPRIEPIKLERKEVLG